MGLCVALVPPSEAGEYSLSMNNCFTGTSTPSLMDAGAGVGGGMGVFKLSPLPPPSPLALRVRVHVYKVAT